MPTHAPSKRFPSNLVTIVRTFQKYDGASQHTDQNDSECEFAHEPKSAHNRDIEF